MRDFFINWSEKLVGVFVVIMTIAIVVAGVATMMSPSEMGGGFIPGLLLLVFGVLYAILVGGMMYLFFGIFRNTQRTNQLLEELARK